MKKILLTAVCCCFTLSNAWAAPETVLLSDLEEFSGLPRVTIMQKRYEAVETSPLFDLLEEDYSPNPDVFQIQDKAPWISAYEISCHGISGNKNIAQGVSRESLGILNPELLLQLEVLSYRFNETENGCSPVDYLIPDQVTYDADKKLITAHIDYSTFLNKNKSFYPLSLMDANAHDLGYKFVYADIVAADKDKNFLWKSPNNVTTSIIQTKGYYHLGANVCQELGGCNNYSPAQPEYELYFQKLPFELHFKLWKNMPSSTSDEADISYHMVFE